MICVNLFPPRIRYIEGKDREKINVVNKDKDCICFYSVGTKLLGDLEVVSRNVKPSVLLIIRRISVYEQENGRNLSAELKQEHNYHLQDVGH